MKEIFPSVKPKYNDSSKAGEEKLKILMKLLPKKQIVAVIGYGSAHFPQPGNKPAQFDFIVIVRNLNRFFERNLQENPTHYTKIVRKIGVKGITGLNYGGGKIFYHLLPSIGLKYGVIGFEDFKKDLQTWKTFYIAGRVQKPIRLWCVENNKVSKLCEEIKFLIEQDRENMLKISVLRLIAQYPNQDSWQVSFDDLIEAIVKISFKGTFRMVMGFEDPDKVQKIIKGGRKNLKDIYYYHLKKIGVENIDVKIEFSKKQIYLFMNQLCKSEIRFSKCFCQKDIIESIRCFDEHLKILNFRKSFSQAFKGVFSGHRKDIKVYVLRKIKKGDSFLARLIKRFSERN